ncbi:M15 family metallopeptidase [Actinoplanes subtropicus]|uniref:M15 family metallopeptidase n=1 Tax=Actinoplanes subtropicus TaxID=543632 RepID=UPI00068B3035|nr:M15 family metallopeptidase [Actinoplanes subtropicus]
MRKYRAIVAAVLATTPIVGVSAQPADAVVPAAAKTWSSLMYTAFNGSPEIVKLRAMLPDLRRTVITSKVAIGEAIISQSAAQASVTMATSANLKARRAYATASAARKAAKTSIERRRQLAAERQRSADLNRSVVTLRTAQTRLRTATAKLAAANDAWHAANVAVRNAEQKIAAFGGYDPDAAARAAQLARQVVTDTRATFTIDDTTQVYGITVNKTIAYAFQHMIDDAAKAGVPMSGGGFRTKEQQIKLRVTNGCPDIWTAPASSCRVPTAIPGHSLHEIGLAVDLTYGGRAIPNHDSVAYQWLAANASRYGFENLPSEPWHWSITGN